MQKRCEYRSDTLGVKVGGRAVEHVVATVSALLDVRLEGSRVKWLEQFEAAQKLGRNSHDSSPVVKLAAVVRSAENSNKHTISVELITVLNNHVRSANQIEIMSGEEV